jgi:hypothetical protein
MASIPWLASDFGVSSLMRSTNSVSFWLIGMLAIEPVPLGEFEKTQPASSWIPRCSRTVM